MLTVRTGAGSPFGRKVRIAISVLGLDGKVKVEPANNQSPDDPIRQHIGKIDDARAALFAFDVDDEERMCGIVDSKRSPCFLRLAAQLAWFVQIVHTGQVTCTHAVLNSPD